MQVVDTTSPVFSKHLLHAFWCAYYGVAQAALAWPQHHAGWSVQQQPNSAQGAVLHDEHHSLPTQQAISTQRQSRVSLSSGSVQQTPCSYYYAC